MQPTPNDFDLKCRKNCSELFPVTLRDKNFPETAILFGD